MAYPLNHPLQQVTLKLARERDERIKQTKAMAYVSHNLLDIVEEHGEMIEQHTVTTVQEERRKKVCWTAEEKVTVSTVKAWLAFGLCVFLAT